jgi:uncharacterized peroxidase-related enzyme
MLHLQLHTPDTAPDRSVAALEDAQRAFGFIPNLLASLANAPAALNAYMGVASALESSSLTAVEQQVVLLAASIENQCHYCVAAHSTVAGMAGATEPVIEAIRAQEPVQVTRIEALRAFTTSVVRHRGWVPTEELDAFLDAGFTPAQVLEVLTGVTLKTLSNYMNHLAATPVDGAFAKQVWSPEPEEVSATS